MTAKYCAVMRTKSGTSKGKHKRRARLVSISISGVSPTLVEKIEERAERDRRSKSFVIVEMLEKAVTEEEAAQAAGENQQASSAA